MSRWEVAVDGSSAEGWGVGEVDGGWWVGGLLRSQAVEIVSQHNAAVTVQGQRPTVGNVEEFATRVMAAAIREVLRDLRPRWWRRTTTRQSPGGDKPVYDTEESDARAR